ncbi:MAG TPA: PAS domain-containing protein, partial [Magnetospirillaceae bacterium]|nr:PAS domain-containing protein [Magnetospirillaceae bacterium]
QILQRLCDTLMEVCGAGSAGVSVPATQDPEADFVWVAVAGALAPFVGGAMLCDANLCRLVVAWDAVLIYPDVQHYFPSAAGLSPPVEEVMLAPFHRDGKAVGAIWVASHDRARRFDLEDRRLLLNLASFASAAYTTARADEALGRTRDRYRALLNSVDAGFCVIEMIFDDRGHPADYRFIEVNPAFEKHTGLADATGRTMRQLVPAHEQHWFDIYGKVALTGQPARFERPADGLCRWFDVHAWPVGARGDNQVAILFADISERRRMELALRASEHQFRTLAEAVPNHVWTARSDGALDWFNRRVYAYSGARTGELDGNGWTSIVHPDDRAGAMAAWVEAVGAGGDYTAECRLRRHDGAYRWHIVRASPLRDEENAMCRWIGTNTDIQEQKEAAEVLADLNATLEKRVEARTRALRESENFARLALSAVSGVGVWTYDAISDRFVCDEAIAKLCGLDPAAAAAGLSAADFLANVHPDDRAPLSARIAEGLKRAGDIEVEYRLVHTDGSVHWILSRGHTYFENGEPVRHTGVGVDTTHLRQLEEQLRQSQKMDAIGQLTGGIAHDFNNMLTGISTSLEMIQRRMAAGRTDGIERLLDTASSAAQRAACLTHRLLAFARRQALDTKSHDIATLIREMEDMLHRTLGEGVRLKTYFAPDLWCGSTDANQFENALLNLAINARDAMPKGGELTIEARNARLDEAYAKKRSDVTPGDYIAVAVSDTGVGMSAAVIAKAFDPFFTTKPMGQGTGLGLSVIYGFAKQTGGHVRIHSKPGQGTTVTLYVARASPVQEAAPPPAPGPAPNGEGEAILLVEDDPSVRVLIGEILQDIGYRYVETDSALSAIRIIESDAVIDLLLSDVGLPVMNGRELAERARIYRPGLKVLFVTGYAENALLRSEFLAPGMDMITKPFGMVDLANKIRALIA